MNGPRIVCAGCGSPTSGINAICDGCMGADSGPPVTRCLLCEGGNKANRWGLHLTASGGYMGKCTEFTSLPAQEKT